MSNRYRSILRLRHELDRYTVFVATAAFTVVATAAAIGELDLPGGMPLLVLVPAGMLIISLRRPDAVLDRELRGSAAWCALVLVAFYLVPILTGSLLLAAGLPFALGTAMLVAKWPAAAAVLALLLSAITGSVQAFIGLNPAILLDLILVALWLVLMARVVLGRPYTFVLWPAVLGCALFIGLTAIDMLTSDNFGRAWVGFHTTVWYMLGFFVLAYAGWSRDTYRRIAIGFVGVAVLVAGYATLRWVTGPAGAERTLAEFAGGGINVDPIDKTLRSVGSFVTAHQLALWTGFMAPFCLAIALWLTGWKRLLAVGGTLLCVAGMMASEARGPLPGFVAGAAVILALYVVARAFPGFKAGITLLVIFGAAATAGGVFIMGEKDPERLERYSGIIEPGSAPTFIQRQNKWEQVLPEIEEHPFGHGLGSGGAGQSVAGETVELSEFAIDNSYLMIAYEQGILVMVFFLVVILGLLVSLAVATVRTRSRQAAALGMGACGTLVSILVAFYSGDYIEAAAIPGAWLIVGLGLAQFVARETPAPAPGPAPGQPFAQRVADTRQPQPQPVAAMTR